MPMSKQDCIIPTLRTLWSGAELYDTNGMKNCGMTEDAPTSKGNALILPQFILHLPSPFNMTRFSILSEKQ